MRSILRRQAERIGTGIGEQTRLTISVADGRQSTYVTEPAAGHERKGAKGGWMIRSSYWSLGVLALVLGIAVGGGGLSCHASQLPDFALDSLAGGCIFFVEGSEILQGRTVEVQAVLVNNSSIPPDALVDVVFTWRRIDKEQICGFETLSLQWQAGGRSAEISAEIDTTSLVPGTYVVSVIADPEDSIAEMDETNNTCSRTLVVLPVEPELRPLRLELTAVSPVERGETTGILVEVENTGDTESGEFEVVFELAPVAQVVAGTDEVRVVDVDATGTTENGLARIFAVDQPLAEDLVELIPGASFAAIGTALVPGLSQGERVTVEQVLDSAEQLDELLAQILVASDVDPAGIVGGTGTLAAAATEQVDVLRTSETIYVLRASITHLGGLPEQDPDNNSISTFFAVVPSELDYAELRPVSITLSHDTPVAWRLPNGPTVGVTVTVMNVGGSIANPAPGDGDIIVRYYVRKAGAGVENPWEERGDYPISQIAIEEGLNSASAYREIDFDEPGEYQIRVVVDPPETELPYGRIKERNEDNNSIVTGLSVEGTELHPVSVELGATPIHQGDTIEVVTVVENTGRQTADTFTVGFFVDGTRVDTAYYRGGGLAQGESVSLRGYMDTADFPASTYNLRIVVDPDGRHADNDRMNNEMTIPLRINEPPERLAELHPTEVELTPPSPLLRDAEDALPDDAYALDISARVKNTGSIDSGRFQIEFASRYRASADVEWGQFHADCRAGECSGPFFCIREDVSDLPRLTSKLVRLTCDVTDWPEGLYEIRVRVDPPTTGAPSGEVAEQDELNNTMIIGFRIGPSEAATTPPTPHPNLFFKALVVDPAQDADARVPIAITEAVVENTGLAPAGAYDVALCWQGRDGSCIPVGDTISFDGLAEQTEIDIAADLPTVLAPATPGSYSLCATASLKDPTSENGWESDNSRCAHVQVTGMIKPDLAVDSVWFSPEPPLEEGDSVTAYARIRNVSSDVGAGAFDVRFEQLDGGPVRDYPISSLGPGQTRDLSFGLSTSNIGDFVLQVTADVNDDVTESDDDDETNNNVASVSFSVAAVLPETVEEVTSLGSAARFVEADTSRDIVYAASTGGHVVALQAAQDDEILFDVTIAGNEVVDVALLPGSGLYVAQSDRVVVLDPLTGASLDEILIPESLSATVLAVRSDETLYVGTTSGVMVVASGSIAMGGGPDEQVAALVVDSAANYTYVMTASSVYVLDDSLVVRCNITNLPGAPVALALGPNALYVGTDDGTVSAYTLCNGGGIIRIWQAAGDGLLSSIVVDPNDFDPIYVGVQEGRLVALDAFGRVMWPFVGSESVPLAELVSPPAWDGRTGRVFLVDMDGTAWILDSSGSEAFPIDSSASQGVSVRSTLVIDDYVTSTSTGAQIERVYYYGGEDGKVYVLRTER